MCSLSVTRLAIELVGFGVMDSPSKSNKQQQQQIFKRISQLQDAVPRRAKKGESDGCHPENWNFYLNLFRICSSSFRLFVYFLRMDFNFFRIFFSFPLFIRSFTPFKFPRPKIQKEGTKMEQQTEEM